MIFVLPCPWPVWKHGQLGDDANSKQPHDFIEMNSSW
jgi:hypothetical protein